MVTIPVPSTDGETPADSTQAVVEAAPSLSPGLPPVVMSPAVLAGVQAGTTRHTMARTARLAQALPTASCGAPIVRRVTAACSSVRKAKALSAALVAAATTGSSSVGRRPARGRTCGRPDAGSPARAGHEGKDNTGFLMP